MKTYYSDHTRPACGLARWLSALALISGTFAIPVRADDNTEYFDALANAADTNGWVVPAYYPNGLFTFTNGGFRLQANATPIPATAAIYAPGLGYTNFQISLNVLDWDPDPWPSSFASINLVARLQGEDSILTQSAYVFQLRPNGDTNIPSDGLGCVGIFRGDPNSVTGAITNLYFPINLNDQYRLVFTGNGPLLTGQLFDLTNLAQPVVAIQMTDTKYSSGELGILAFDDGAAGDLGNKPVDFTVNNFRAGPPTPLLAIQQSVTLSWPDSYAGCIAQTATSLSGPWQSLSVTPEDSAGLYTATVAATNSSQFFRLLYQP
jgi:hypothetical protein